MNSRRSLVKYRGEECLNCGRSLEEEHKFCPNCGQLNSIKKLALGDFFSEFFSGLFAYDSRFIRTMRILLFKPGKISKDYIQGKRMRYVNPYRFFLTTAIITKPNLLEIAKNIIISIYANAPRICGETFSMSVSFSSLSKSTFSSWSRASRCSASSRTSSCVGGKSSSMKAPS